MGDGQHGWAAGEWVLMMRSLFVREEGNALVIGSGVFQEWLSGSHKIGYGPTPTPHGEVTVNIEPENGGAAVEITGDWRKDSPEIRIEIPGFEAAAVNAGENSSRLTMKVNIK